MANKSVIPDPDKTPVITVPQAGALLGMRKRASYYAAARDEIPTIGVGRRNLKVPTRKFLREVLGYDV